MFYIDSKADSDQRHALEQIFTGQQGGWAGEFGSLIGELRGIEYAPITFDAAPDLTYWQAEIPGKVNVRVEALTGPTCDLNQRVTTVNAPGAEVGPGQIATWRYRRESRCLASKYGWVRSALLSPSSTPGLAEAAPATLVPNSAQVGLSRAATDPFLAGLQPRAYAAPLSTSALQGSG